MDNCNSVATPFDTLCVYSVCFPPDDLGQGDVMYSYGTNNKMHLFSQII